MLDVKTRHKNNVEFIRTCAVPQLFFVQFRPYAFHSVQTFCNLIPKVSLFDVNVKMTLETSLDLMPLFKTSVDH